MPYPTILDFKAFLAERDLACSSLGDSALKAALAAAVKAWESSEYGTGWFPFLATPASPSEETRTIHGPEGRLIFPPFGIISLSALSIGSSELVENTGYWLQYKLNDGPYQAIELDGYATGERRSVVMTGRFGYTATLPLDVKDAILSLAAWRLYPQITGLEGNIKSEKQGPVEFTYAVDSSDDAKYAGKRGALLFAYDQTVQIYKRVSL